MATRWPSLKKHAGCWVLVVLLGLTLLGAQRTSASLTDVIDSVAGYKANCVKRFYDDAGDTVPLLTLRTALNCLKSVQMNPQKALALAHAAQANFEVYSLRGASPAARDAIYSLTTGVLDTSVSPPTWLRFMSEHEFLQRVQLAMQLARDLHFVFVPPSLYSESLLLRPYNLASRLNKTTNLQELYIVGWSDWWPFILEKARADPTAVGVPGTWSADQFIAAVDKAIDSGAAIATMNGLDPITEWFPSVEAAYGHQDKGANFNNGLLNNFVWPLYYSPPQLSGLTHQGQTYCNASSTPCDRDDLYDRLVMSDGSNIVGLKWVFLSGSVDYPTSCSVFGAVGGSSASLRTEAKSMLPPLPLKVPRRLPEPEPNHTLSRRIQGPDTAVQKARMLRSVLNDTFRTYMSNNKDLALLEINSFSPAHFDWDSLDELRVAIEELRNMSVTAGNHRLFIDVTGNGGGYIVLMDLCVKLLFPKIFYTAPVEDANEEFSYPNFTTRSFPAFSTSINPKLMSSSPANGGDSVLYNEFGPIWFGGLLNLTYRGADMYPIVTETEVLRGTGNPWWTQYRSGTASYPTPYYYDPIPIGFPWTWEELQTSANNPFTEVKIMSDGQCGSACAMFVSRLSTFVPDTEVITYGGWKDSRNPQMQTSQFCGGTVYRMSCIADSHLIRYNFLGLESNIGKSSYYPADFTSNVLHFFSDPSIDVRTNTPRQLESVVGDDHWWAWEPTFEEKVAKVYPNVEFSAALGSPFHLALLFALVLALQLLAH